MATHVLAPFARPMRHFARDAIAHAGARTGWLAPTRGKLVVLTFHRVLPAEQRARYPYPGLTITPGELSWLLCALAPRYTLGPLAELHRRHAAGERPERPLLALTFDDGQRDNSVHARPVLTRHGVRATFFVPVDAIESQRPLWHDELGFAVRSAGERGVLSGLFRARRRTKALAPALAEVAKTLSPTDRERLVRALKVRTGAEVPAWAGMMSWSEVRALAAEGHEIGSHSMSHVLLPQCDEGTLDHEAARSKAIIEERIERPVESFCYPNGDSDARVVAAVRRAGYQRAVTTRAGTNGPRAPTFTLSRCDMDPRRLCDRAGALSPSVLQLRLA